MAARLSAQLDGLQRERERLEELLMLDANWRALRQLQAREAAGEPLAAFGGTGIKASLEASLRTNRVYEARAKLIETMELLQADFPARSAVPANGTLASRIVMLSEPDGDTFRARLRLKSNAVAVAADALTTVETPPEPAGPPARASGEGSNDALELIDGFGPRAVEHLLDAGVNRFAEIAAWSAADAGAWSSRLEGIAHGTPGWWIEQAALLASGGMTKYARRVRSGEFTSLVAPPAAEPARVEPSTTPAQELPQVPPQATPPAPGPAPGPALGPAVETASARSVPILEPATAPSPATVSAPRSMTAEQLVEALAVTSVVAPQPPPQNGAAAPTGTSPAAITAGADPALPPTDGRAGYIRPQHRATSAAPEGDRSGRNGAAAATADEPATLMRRLKALHNVDRFEAAAYAAYRSSVEEASVTILAGAGAASASVGQNAERAAATSLPANSPANSSASQPVRQPVSRFFKALTGKP